MNKTIFVSLQCFFLFPWAAAQESALGRPPTFDNAVNHSALVYQISGMDAVDLYILYDASLRLNPQNFPSENLPKWSEVVDGINGQLSRAQDIKSARDGSYQVANSKATDILSGGLSTGLSLGSSVLKIGGAPGILAEAGISMLPTVLDVASGLILEQSTGSLQLRAQESTLSIRNANLPLNQIAESVGIAYFLNPDFAQLYDRVFLPKIGMRPSDSSQEILATLPDFAQFLETFKISKDVEALTESQQSLFFSEAIQGWRAEVSQKLEQFEQQGTKLEYKLDALLTEQARLSVRSNIKRAEAEERDRKDLQRRGEIAVVSLVSTLVSFENPTLGKQLEAVGLGYFKVLQSLENYDKAKGLSESMAGAVLTWDMMSVALSITAAFSNQPTHDEIVIEMLGNLSQQIDRLHKEMRESFQHIDRRLITLQVSVGAQLEQLFKQIQELRMDLSRIERGLQYDRERMRSSHREQINQGLAITQGFMQSRFDEMKDRLFDLNLPWSGDIDKSQITESNFRNAQRVLGEIILPPVCLEFPRSARQEPEPTAEVPEAKTWMERIRAWWAAEDDRKAEPKAAPLSQLCRQKREPGFESLLTKWQTEVDMQNAVDRLPVGYKEYTFQLAGAVNSIFRQPQRYLSWQASRLPPQFANTDFPEWIGNPELARWVIQFYTQTIFNFPEYRDAIDPETLRGAIYVNESLRQFRSAFAKAHQEYREQRAVLNSMNTLEKASDDWGRSFKTATDELSDVEESFNHFLSGTHGASSSVKENFQRFKSLDLFRHQPGLFRNFRSQLCKIAQRWLPTCFPRDVKNVLSALETKAYDNFRESSQLITIKRDVYLYDSTKSDRFSLNPIFNAALAPLWSVPKHAGALGAMSQKLLAVKTMPEVDQIRELKIMFINISKDPMFHITSKERALLNINLSTKCSDPIHNPLPVPSEAIENKLKKGFIQAFYARDPQLFLPTESDKRQLSDLCFEVSSFADFEPRQKVIGLSNQQIPLGINPKGVLAESSEKNRAFWIEHLQSPVAPKNLLPGSELHSQGESVRLTIAVDESNRATWMEYLSADQLDSLVEKYPKAATIKAFAKRSAQIPRPDERGKRLPEPITVESKIELRPELTPSYTLTSVVVVPKVRVVQEAQNTNAQAISQSRKIEIQQFDLEFQFSRSKVDTNLVTSLAHELEILNWSAANWKSGELVESVRSATEHYTNLFRDFTKRTTHLLLPVSQQLDLQDIYLGYRSENLRKEVDRVNAAQDHRMHPALAAALVIPEVTTTDVDMKYLQRLRRDAEAEIAQMIAEDVDLQRLDDELRKVESIAMTALHMALENTPDLHPITAQLLQSQGSSSWLIPPLRSFFTIADSYMPTNWEFRQLQQLEPQAQARWILERSDFVWRGLAQYREAVDRFFSAVSSQAVADDLNNPQVQFSSQVQSAIFRRLEPQ